MSQPEQVLAETRLERRDGRMWVSGLCPGCWERFAFPAPPAGRWVTVVCRNGHSLRIADPTTEGARAREALSPGVGAADATTHRDAPDEAIDEALIETFPASDPPAWTGTHAGAPWNASPDR